MSYTLSRGFLFIVFLATRLPASPKTQQGEEMLRNNDAATRTVAALGQNQCYFDSAGVTGAAGWRERLRRPKRRESSLMIR